MTETLSNRRIMLVEDEALVMMFLETTLADAGCHLMAATKLSDAIALAAVEALDCAYLDINVGGAEVYPVAEILSRRGIPYVLSTGHSRESVSVEYRAQPILMKPFTADELVRAVTAAIEIARHPG